MALTQRNPVLEKIAAELQFAGAGTLGPILAGLAGRLRLAFNSGEALQSVRLYNPASSYESHPAYSFDTDTGDALIDLVFGADTDSGASSRRNVVEWTTNFGVSRAQFWVRDLPAVGSIYCDGQECQAGEATIFVNHESPVDPMEEDASFSINLLATFNDEFFTQHEYEGNRFANTVRNWGGAATAQVEIDGSEVIAEQDIADLDGYYWSNPSYGLHTIRARLRASTGSSDYVDVYGHLRVRQIPCP